MSNKYKALAIKALGKPKKRGKLVVESRMS